MNTTTNQESILNRNWTAQPSSLVPGGLSDILSRQHLQVFEAMVTGEPVLFLNSDGATEELRFEGAPGGNSFVILSHNERLLVRSHLSEDQTTKALCKLADIFCRLPVSFRFLLRTVELRDAAGSSKFCNIESKLKIYGGLDGINEEKFEPIFG